MITTVSCLVTAPTQSYYSVIDYLPYAVYCIPVT